MLRVARIGWGQFSAVTNENNAWIGRAHMKRKIRGGKPIRFGVFGVGRGSASTGDGARAAGFELVALCDKNADALKRAAKLHSVKGYTDFDKFLEHDMDAVVVANYFHQHAPFAIKALKAGMHVMSETAACHTLAEGVALVLIDEIELHLHPKWQRDVLQRLRDIFKACQFVVTTHSPLVLGEVPARCVRFLEFMDGKVVVTVPTEAYGMDANRILQELMGAPVRNRQVESELKALFELIDQERFDDARITIAALENKLGENEPELTRASSLIHFLEGVE